MVTSTFARFAARTAVVPILAAAWVAASPRIARAGDVHASIPLGSLKLEHGVELPQVRTFSGTSWPFLAFGVEPYAVLDGGTAYVHGVTGVTWPEEPVATSLSVRGPDDRPWKGRLFVPDATTGELRSFAFEIERPADSPEARRLFLQDEFAFHQQLAIRSLPGAAWFRHVSTARAKELGTAGTGTEAENRWPRTSPADPLDLFTGSRAVAENLDLSRPLRLPAPGDTAIPVDSITGVTTRAMDWKALVTGMKPTLDPLARFVPEDQHAVFFPTFDAMTRVIDEFDERGTQFLELFGASAEDHGTRLRYQEQLCLPFSTLGRLLGPAVVESVAVTGSDPFVVGGTDVVVLFQCKQPELLEGFVRARQAEAVSKGATGVDGEILGAKYVGVLRPDRTVSSYLVRFDDVVIVSNSFPALTRVGMAARDATRSLLAADEYVWFRDRYRRGDPGESAFLILTDATIRRWAGPRSRIGDARRLQAAAAMAEIQARNLDALVAGTVVVGSSAAATDLPLSADFVWGRDGVVSPRYGTLTSLTPITELGVDSVSAEEKSAYENFRNTFQTRWRSFDPIAARFGLENGRLAIDVTIQPLTLDTDYEELRKWTAGATLDPHAGDPHETTLFHVVTAVAKRGELSALVREFSGAGSSRFGADPLSWLGSTFEVWGEKDRWWDDLRASGGLDGLEDVDLYSVPIVLRVAVTDPLKLAAFLTALRTFADEAAPNLVRWENREWKGTTYVRVAPIDGVLPKEGDAEPALYYASFPDALLLTLREDLLRQAIERRAERKAATEPREPGKPWIGGSAALRFEPAALDLLGERLDQREVAAWSALPILDAWKRRYPAEDPVALHQRFWGVKLSPPDGGRYVWNEARQRMEASNYGAPGARPKERVAGALRGLDRAELGVTFEGEGLRVRAELEREHKAR